MRAASGVKIGIALVAVSALAFLQVRRAASSQEFAASADAKVIGIFEAHRGEFERLRQMATEDMRTASFFSETNISNGLPEPRRNEYKHLLNVSPGLQVGTNYDGSVRFIFASAGEAIGPGWAKGIEFIPDGQKVIGTQRDTLDDPAKLPQGVYLRKVEPRWFVFFQRDE